MSLNEVADALGVTLAGRLPHGAGTGAHAVRTADGTDAVLKVFPGEVRDARWEDVTAALRTRGYPIPGVIQSGNVDGVRYELSERVVGEPMDNAAAQHLPALLRLVDLQRDAGDGRREWIDDMVTSVTEGRTGYCEHTAMETHSAETRTLLERLRRLADARRDLDVPTDDAVHYDFSPYNVLVRGADVTGVVDWDGARFGDAAFDLVTLAFYTYDRAVRDALLKAAAARTDPRALELYTAHMVLRQIDWTLRHDDAVTAEWFMGVGETLLGRVAT